MRLLATMVMASVALTGCSTAKSESVSCKAVNRLLSENGDRNVHTCREAQGTFALEGKDVAEGVHQGDKITVNALSDRKTDRIDVTIQSADGRVLNGNYAVADLK